MRLAPLTLLLLAIPVLAGAQTAYGPYSSNQLTKYAPVGHSNGNAVVVSHGNWATGSRNQANAVQLAQSFANAGFTAFAIDYRLIGNYTKDNFPAPIQDAQMAVRYVRSLGFKTVGIAGESAGAELALFAGGLGNRIMVNRNTDPLGEAGMLTQFSSRPDFVVDISGPVDQGLYEIDMPGKAGTLRIEQGLPVSRAAADAIVSPISYIGGDMPPTIIFQGLSDPHIRVDQTNELVGLLKYLGVSYQYVTYRGGHVLGDLSDAAVAGCLDTAVRFALWKRPVVPDRACR